MIKPSANLIRKDAAAKLHRLEAVIDVVGGEFTADPHSCSLFGAQRMSSFRPFRTLGLPDRQGGTVRFHNAHVRDGTRLSRRHFSRCCQLSPRII